MVVKVKPINKMSKLKLMMMTLMMCLVTMLSFSQTKITGMGKLKLGATVSLINELGYEVISVKDYSEVLDSKNQICKLIADTNETSQPTIYGKSDPRTSVYYVPKIKVNEVIEIKEVFLTFFNDTLVKIECDYNSELNDAFDIKYGKSELKVTETPHNFTRKYTGQEIKLTDVLYEKEWLSNGVRAYSELKKYYSDSIEPKYISYFIVYNINAVKDIEDTSKLYEKRAQKRKDDAKKKSLSDF